jgi:ankyrin repeat protein
MVDQGHASSNFDGAKLVHEWLMEAIRTGHTDLVEIFLSGGVDPDLDAVGPPASFKSLNCANPKILQLLLEHGADPNAKFQGHSLLHRASSLSRLDLVQILLEFEVDVNASDELGRTALFNAVKARDILIVQRLYRKGVNLLAKDRSNGRCALHEAAIAGDVEVVSFLLSRYDDLAPVDSVGKTPLDYARELHRLDIVFAIETRILMRARNYDM